MRDYYNWCLKLKENWKSKNIEQMIELFDEKVEYYETPTMKIDNMQEIKEMWEEIESQNTDNIITICKIPLRQPLNGPIFSLLYNSIVS